MLFLHLVYAFMLLMDELHSQKDPKRSPCEFRGSSREGSLCRGPRGWIYKIVLLGLYKMDRPETCLQNVMGSLLMLIQNFQEKKLKWRHCHFQNPTKCIDLLVQTSQFVVFFLGHAHVLFFLTISVHSFDGIKLWSDCCICSSAGRSLKRFFWQISWSSAYNMSYQLSQFSELCCCIRCSSESSCQHGSQTECLEFCPHRQSGSCAKKDSHTGTEGKCWAALQMQPQQAAKPKTQAWLLLKWQCDLSHCSTKCTWAVKLLQNDHASVSLSNISMAQLLVYTCIASLDVPSISIYTIYIYIPISISRKIHQNHQNLFFPASSSCFYPCLVLPGHLVLNDCISLMVPLL